MTIKNNLCKEFIIKHRDILVCTFLIMATLAVYWQVHNHDFLNYDDNLYYTDNRHVQVGLTIESIIWSFDNTIAGMWIPATWLSYMAGSSLHGTSPGWHHLTNVFIHMTNILLLYLLLRGMTGAFWPSVSVATLFALHPIHVESVAWITERKDVLSTFFFLLTIRGYSRYVDQPTVGKYILMLLFFTLGLMAKPMIATLPLVLLLLDYWPLGRFKLRRFNSRSDRKRSFKPLFFILEKIPFFALAAAASVATFIATRKLGGVASFDGLPLDARIANAMVSYVKYIGKMIWPSKMAVFYPYPEILPWWKTLGAFIVLAGISLIVVKNIERRPYLAVGWLWFLGALAPVIGLVQAGKQAMADRFVYVPFIGLYIIFSWGVPELVAQWRFRKIWLSTSATLVLTILMAMTWKQVGYWKNSITLFEHTLKVTANNSVSHYNLGLALVTKGQFDKAIDHYLQALRIKPDDVEVHNSLGIAFNLKGNIDEAIAQFRKALRINPDYVEAHNNLGIVLKNQGRTEEAIDHYLQALRIDPDYMKAHHNLEVALKIQGRAGGDVGLYSKILQMNPVNEKALFNLAVALHKYGRIDEAIDYYLQALRIKPDYMEAHHNLGNALYRQGRIDKAIDHYLQALRIKPDYVETHYNLGLALVKKGRIDKAIDHYLQALRIKPDYAEVHNSLGIAFYRKGNIEGAIAQFRKALRINPEYVRAKNNLKKVLMVQKRNQ